MLKGIMSWLSVFTIASPLYATATEVRLSNQIPVTFEQVSGSDIVQVVVTFDTGIKDLPSGEKALNELYWSVSPLASRSIPKAKVFNITEKYGLSLGCSGGIELSQCGLGTINDYWREGLGLLASVIKEPLLSAEDFKLSKERLEAQYKSAPSDPGSYVNEVVNSVFYPEGHPYRLLYNEGLADLNRITMDDLKAYHKDVIRAGNISIVVVTSLPQKKVLADLEKAFGKIPQGRSKAVVPEAPKFNPEGAYVFEDRDIPTAFMRMKLNAPGQTHPDAAAVKLLFSILNEMLGDEIRTKRSLSYAVHSFVVQYHLGIGMLSVSTSKPEDTLKAMGEVIKDLKAKEFTATELNDYKREFQTAYYLTQETHESLALALAQAKYYYGTGAALYEFPARLEAVTPQDIKRLANAILGDLRVGVIYKKSEFKDKWVTDLIGTTTIE